MKLKEEEVEGGMKLKKREAEGGMKLKEERSKGRDETQKRESQRAPYRNQPGGRTRESRDRGEEERKK
jgi:hypothetical protein